MVLINPSFVDEERDETHHTNDEWCDELSVLPPDDWALCEAGVEKGESDEHDEDASDVEFGQKGAGLGVSVAACAYFGKEEEGQDRAWDADDGDEAEEPSPAGCQIRGFKT